MSLLSLLSYAQISLTATGTAYSEDFTGMGTSATASLPNGFKIGLDWNGGAITTTHAAGTTGTGTLTTTSSGGAYNFATGITATSTDRALGFLSSGSYLSPRSVVLKITNNTSGPITDLSISFDYEKYRSNTRAFDWTFFHGSTSAPATAEATGNQSYGSDAANVVLNPPTVISKSITLTGLGIAMGTDYYLRWTYTGSGGSSNAQALGIDNFSITAGGTPLPPCAEPASQPTNLLLSATASTVAGSFDVIPAPTSVLNYLIVRSLSTPLTQEPVDGTTYTAGQIIGGGNGSAVGQSADGTFTNSTAPSTQYYYFIFAMNDQACGGGPNYNQTLPLSGSITTPALAACITPAAPTALVLTPANTTISGTFTGSGASRYLTVISTATPLSASPVNGMVYSAGQVFGNGTVVSYSAGTTFTATGLIVSTLYYLYVFAANDVCTGEPFYNTGSLAGSTTTTNASTGIPPGYYASAAGTCQPLKTSVKNIITAGYQTLTYTPGLWNLFQFSDLHRNDANTADIMWDMYSDNPTGPEPYVFTYVVNQCGTYTTEGNCYNREHSSPQSWFNQVSPMVSDAHHIFATDGQVNNMRSSFPYGEVTTLIGVPAAQNNPSLNGSKLGTGNNFGYTGTVFEPISPYKGDFARAGLYMSARYEDEIIAQNWSAFGNANAVFLSATDEPDAAKRRLQIYDLWHLNLLIKWHNQDPVSQKEIDRNNAIYYTSVNTTSAGSPKAQGNRNPFIDHPEYVALIFQCTNAILPVTIINFTAQKNKESVLLKWYATFETSFKQYDVERSTDGLSFSKIGEVAGRNLADYNFTDNNLPKSSVVYYRLKMIDLDGKFEHSKIASVRLNNNFSNAIVYPNPTFGKLNIKLDEALLSAGTLQIVDVAGRKVKQQAVQSGTVNIGLDVNNLTAGRYFIKIITGNEVINQSFVVIK